MRVFWWVTQVALRILRPSSLQMHTEDRFILEKIIFRSLFLDPSVQRILFVGCHRYSSWYWRVFYLSMKKFYTVDPDPSVAQYGSLKRHFISTFQQLKERPELFGAFDLIILNGVFGYGINTEDEKKDALKTSASLLSPEGRLLIGFRNAAICDFDTKLVDSTFFGSVNVPGYMDTYVDTRHENGHAFICFKKH